jgi:hypothetical protein
VVDYNEACGMPADGRESPPAGALVDSVYCVVFLDDMRINFISILHCVLDSNSLPQAEDQETAF